MRRALILTVIVVVLTTVAVIAAGPVLAGFWYAAMLAR